MYDVASVRGLYTGLSDGWTYLNAHDAPQIAERVASGVARSFRTASAVASRDVPQGSHSALPPAGRLEAHALYDAAQVAVADLVGATADRVVLGPNLPSLYQSLVRAMAPMFRHNSSVVVSRLDDAPGLRGADAQLRWAQPDLGTGELPAFQYGELVDGSTRLVSFAAAHHLLGTVAPVSEIVDQVRSRSRAWTLVDVSAWAASRPVDFDEFGADVLGIDLGQLGGPQIAALVFRDSAMFKRLDSKVSLRTPISAGLAGGVSPLVDHLARLAGASEGSRRERVAESMAQLQYYMDDLSEDLYTFLSTLPTVHILGYTGEAAAGASADRIPRLSFAVSGVPAEMVHQRLFANGLVTTLTPPTPLLEDMGMAEIGGAVTVALAPFNTRYDVEHLIRTVASLA